MRVSQFLAVAVCAGTLALAGQALAEDASAESGDTAASVENGKKLFTDERNCSTCHTGAVAPAPADLGKYDREAFGKKVESHAAVGAFDGITEEELNDIYAYLQSQVKEG